MKNFVRFFDKRTDDLIVQTKYNEHNVIPRRGERVYIDGSEYKVKEVMYSYDYATFAETNPKNVCMIDIMLKEIIE